MKQGALPVCHQWVLEGLQVLPVLPLPQTWHQGSHFPHLSHCHHHRHHWHHCHHHHLAPSDPPPPSMPSRFSFSSSFSSSSSSLSSSSSIISGNARGAKEPERRHSLYDSASRGQYKVRQKHNIFLFIFKSCWINQVTSNPGEPRGEWRAGSSISRSSWSGLWWWWRGWQRWRW